MAMQLRGVPSRTAFSGRIQQYVGLFYVQHGSPYAYAGTRMVTVLCLDVQADPNVPSVGFGTTMPFRGDTDIEDYFGPVDLKLSVRGYSPKRGPRDAPSHIMVREEKIFPNRTTRHLVFREEEGETE